MKENNLINDDEKLPSINDFLSSDKENPKFEIKHLIDDEINEKENGTSTIDTKMENIINEYKELLKEVDEIKKNGNFENNQKNYSKAIEYYKQGISKLSSFKPSIDIDNKLINELKNEIKATLITLYNNLAVSLEMEKNYDEAINICNNIIMNLDSENEIAYKRILELSLQSNKIDVANIIADKIKEKFQGTPKINQFQKFFSLLDEINNKEGSFWTSKTFLIGGLITIGFVLTYLYKKKWSK